MNRAGSEGAGAPGPGPGGRPAVAPRRDVALMAGYHSPQLDVRVRLNTNEAPEPPPPAWLEESVAAARAIAFNRYPDRQAGELRKRIGELHGCPAEQVYCANGSNEVLQSLLLAYGGEGRAAAVFEPTYALHRHIAGLTGTAVVSAQRGADFLVAESCIDEVLDAGRRLYGRASPAIAFLCSPNNPTGRLEPRPTLERLLERAPGLVVVDEAYGQFAESTAVELLAGHPNLVVVRTFSKTWSLAGLRLGYAVAHPEVVEACFKVTLPYHLDAFKQAAGIAALAYEPEMEERVERLCGERRRVSEALQRLGAAVVPSDANFVLFAPPVADAGELWGTLVESSVLVRDVSGWKGTEGHLRVTIGTPEENDTFLAALAAALSERAAAAGARPAGPEVPSPPSAGAGLAGTRRR